jgi:hypothetical protein
MPNGVKYSTTTPTGALRKDNVALGVNGNLGPTANTGFYSMPAPASGKYIINKVAASGVPLFFAPQNDTELIQLARNEGATGADTGSAAAVLSWIATQPNLEAANFEYENIVTDSLTCNLDARFVGSYPNTGTTWYDLSGNGNNASINIGSPTFTTFEGKRTIRFSNQGKNVYAPPYDGFVLSNNPGISSTSTSFTFESWFYQITADNGQIIILSNAGSCDGYRWGPNGSNTYWLFGDSTCTQFNEGTVSNSSTLLGRWVQMVGIFDRANTLGGGLKFYNYVNGVLQSSVGIFNPVISTSTPGMVACCGAFDGYLSIVRVYNRALTPTEITQNWNAQKSYFGL